MSIQKIKEALNQGKSVTYAGVEVTSMKNGKIETKGDGNYFKPWLPAIRIA